MPSSSVRSVTLLMGIVGLCAIAAGAVGPGPVITDDEFTAKALRLVSEIHGVWHQMPGDIATSRMTKGSLLGNGTVGVALGGTPERQQFYLGRNDFWSVLRGSIMPMGQLQLTIPSLQGASAELSENILPADVTGSFTQGEIQLKTRSWIAAEQNMLFVQLDNVGRTPLPVSASMLDGYGQKDRETLGGDVGNTSWLRVSPEIVKASIGGAIEHGRMSDAEVHTVQIYDRGPLLAGKKVAPVYQWSSKTSLVGSVDPGTRIPNAFSCGQIIMPQREFTVRASAKLRQADGEGVIFSAQVEHRWLQQRVDATDALGNERGHDVPRAQGAEAGLLVTVTHGRLSANLNGTTITAGMALPLDELVSLEVTYDGDRLALRVNGTEIAATKAFPSAAEVIGPGWQWMASHPGDRHLPFAGIAPDGLLAMRILGSKVERQDGEMRFTLAAGDHVILALAASDDRDRADYLPATISALQHLSEKSIDAMRTRHLDSWKQFWAKSYIEIPDKTIQSWWYGSLYVLASCTRHTAVAPGLWGNWITSMHMGWQGDYTLDYNYQAPFWAAFPTNHVDLADSYDAPLLAWMPRGQGLARSLDAQGLVYYTHLAPSPGWSADNFRALDQKSDALFAAVNCIQRWRYTRDLSYARRMWPFLSGVAEFWDHDLKLVDGRYVDMDDAEDEHLWGPSHDTNPATVIGFLKMLYPALIDMSRELGTSSERRATWSQILAHLSPLPIAPASGVKAIEDAVGKPIPAEDQVILESEHGMQWVDISKGDRFGVDPPVKIEGSSAGMNSLQVIFPGWNIGLESSPELQKAAANTVNYTRLWYDSNNTSNIYAAAADAGYDPQSILDHLRLMTTHLGYSSFAFQFDAGGIENEATVPTTIASMFLQSYQKNIHVFADWPKDQDASFGHLLAVGGFLVSSSISAGKVESVEVISQIGGVCRLANPWGAETEVQVHLAGNRTELLRGEVLSVKTSRNQVVRFTPLRH